MTKRNILILDHAESPWVEFLKEFFEDTQSAVQVCSLPKSAGDYLARVPQDVVFANPELLSRSCLLKLKSMKGQRDDFRLFQLGSAKTEEEIPFDYSFTQPGTLVEFQKELVRFLPLPETIRVLVVDDEREIGMMIKDFLEGRTQPSFEVDYTENGKLGLEAIQQKKPDVVISDIKMPEMDGRELYRKVKEEKINVPYIIFFDAISGYEVEEIHRIGRPTIVEKGARQSAMPAMMALIKKMAYFG